MRLRRVWFARKDSLQAVMLTGGTQRLVYERDASSLRESQLPSEAASFDSIKHRSFGGWSP